MLSNLSSRVSSNSLVGKQATLMATGGVSIALHALRTITRRTTRMVALALVNGKECQMVQISSTNINGRNKNGQAITSLTASTKMAFPWILLGPIAWDAVFKAGYTAHRSLMTLRLAVQCCANARAFHPQQLPARRPQPPRRPQRRRPQVQQKLIQRSTSIALEWALAGSMTLLVMRALAGRLAHAMVCLAQVEIVLAGMTVQLIAGQKKIVPHSVGMTNIAGCLVAAQQGLSIRRQPTSSLGMNALQGSELA